MTPLMLILSLAAEAQAFDNTHAALDAVLGAYVAPAGVDYAGLKAGRAGLDAYVDALADAPIDAMGAAEQEAFWINAYNALTLQVIVDAYPLGSIMELEGGKVWEVRRFRVAGDEVSLNDIEHKILRPLGDPRIHAAINCASRGCPPLSSDAFTAAELDAQLDAASRAWATGSAAVIDRGGKSVRLSAIFDWFGDDFVPGYGASRADIPGVEGKQEAALNFVGAYLDGDARAWLSAGGYQVSYGEYDWGLNAR
jgi:hypothetical protein